ncbi:MAG: radical SAM-associated putative lipoprotein [Bacteroidales bacterium]|nr:radical SAM-associated putative lipoprotein [Bacteroidales bacterium]
MKIRFLKLKRWLIMGAAGLLGINLGCDGNGYSDIVCEYGVPEAEFEVKGRVTNRNGEPIRGIVATMAETTDTTDADGRYDLTSTVFARADVDVEFKDVDGPENGQYADTTINVSFTDAEYEGASGNWYMGHASRTVDVELREQTP